MRNVLQKPSGRISIGANFVLFSIYFIYYSDIIDIAIEWNEFSNRLINENYFNFEQSYFRLLHDYIQFLFKGLYWLFNVLNYTKNKSVGCQKETKCSNLTIVAIFKHIYHMLAEEIFFTREIISCINLIESKKTSKNNFRRYNILGSLFYNVIDLQD